MSQRPIDKQNWYARFVESYGPSFRLDANNPQMGCGGEDVYRLYGITKDNKKASFGVDQSGKLKLNSDMSVEIVAGEMAGDKGEDILVHSRRGNVTITADRNGAIKIMGSNITIESTGDMDIKAANQLNEFGISVEVIDVQTLLPFDMNHSIRESLEKTNRILFVDEDVPGGASAYMMQKVLEEQGGYYLLDSEPKTLTSKEHRPAYGSDGDYFSKPSLEDIFDAAYALMHEANPDQYPRIY